jgi:predicted MPP superfamily phosphohydrolase
VPGPLRFRPDGRFRIVQFTDTHLRDGDADDRRTSALIAEVLDQEQPDLAVLTGDVVQGEHAPDPAQAWSLAVDPMEARGVPWAAVLGNHDDEGALDREALMEALRSFPACLAEPGPDRLSGVGNYVLEVASSRGDGPAAHLYFLDTHAYTPTGAGEYDWVRHDQVTWYRETAATNAAAGASPALVFLHIPLPEYDAAWRAGYDVRGTRGGPVCSPAINSGLFAALHERGEALGVFCGHDHWNDFDATLYGTRLCYGRVTGFGGYAGGPLARGARVIELVEGERRFDTWLRVEGGRREDQEPSSR